MSVIVGIFSVFLFVMLMDIFLNKSVIILVIECLEMYFVKGFGYFLLIKWWWIIFCKCVLVNIR